MTEELTKQQEIQKSFEALEANDCIYPFLKIPFECPENYGGSCVPCLLNYLDSKDVVIKVVHIGEVLGGKPVTPYITFESLINKIKVAFPPPGPDEIIDKGL